MKQLYIEAQFIGVWIVYNNFIAEFIITFFSCKFINFQGKKKKKKETLCQVPST